MANNDLRYPIGRFRNQGEISPARRAELIDQLADLPRDVMAALDGISEAELSTPYREGGWTARQVVHHVADSHINMYVRVRLALTEEHPAVRPYKEALWAELSDAAGMPTDVSVALINGLHRRLTTLMRSLPDEAFARTIDHPEYEQPLTLDWLIQLYAWHGRHHVAHIGLARSAAGLNSGGGPVQVPTIG